jgi:2-C-methyl-D-erythritol 4-phosphate cytidylyltransferase
MSRHEAAGRRRRVAVILAAGTGERAGGDVAKQFAVVGDQRVLDHAIAALHDVDGIDEVVVVAPSGRSNEIDATIDRARFPKVSRTIEGGDDRHASTRRALSDIADDSCDVLVHDAARPLVDADVIRACLNALDTHVAVAAAIPSDDTVAEVAGDGTDAVVVGLPDRSRIRLVQTPQGFRLAVLRQAYELAAADAEILATDNCGVVHRYLPDVPVHVVPGSRRNLKITNPDDLRLVEALLGTRA